MKLNLESAEEKIQQTPIEWLQIVISISSDLNSKLNTSFSSVSGIVIFQRIIKDEI